jgi:hypothetical protein
MSHNKLKIGTATQDSTGALSVDLNDLSNVDVSGVQEGSALRFVDAEWTHAPSVSETYATSGYASGWSTYQSGGGNSYTATGALNSYRTFDINNWEDLNCQITFGGLDLDRGTEGGTVPSATRFSRIILDEGKYLLIATTYARSSNSANWVEWQWQDTSTSAVLGPRWRQYGTAQKNIAQGYGYVEVGSGTTRTCDIRCVAINGSMADAPHNYQDDIISAIQIG